MSGVFEGFLQARADRHQEGRPTDDWMFTVLAPEERLLRFDSWARRQLAERLQWPDEPRLRAKLIEQCRVKLERLVIDLWRRGWMLDGQRLARHLLTALDDIAAAQAAGRIQAFWPFFCRVFEGYVGLNAEEIQAEARLVAGARPIGSILSSIIERQQSRGPSLPELVAQRRDETLREKLSKRRKAEATKVAEKAQLSLF
jgi:hypothetical protein